MKLDWNGMTDKEMLLRYEGYLEKNKDCDEYKWLIRQPDLLFLILKRLYSDIKRDMNKLNEKVKRYEEVEKLMKRYNETYR